MREPMTLVEQSNAFSTTNRQRVPLNFVQRSRPVYSALDSNDERSLELKTLSVDVYTSKHLVATGKSIIPYTGRQRLDEIILPAIEKDIHHDEHHYRPKKKRPAYRKSLFHPVASNLNQTDFTQLTARGVKPEFQTVTPIINDEDSMNNYKLHYAPPPSPSDDEIEQLLCKLDAINTSPSPSRLSYKEKDGCIPFRLPTLYRSSQSRRLLPISSSKDVRSTLSHYLRKYY
ncbi:unnamed protein product [Rotaria socialis]|uniref:Uncharacterized protein n=1 Tax=Rotaria socialis TaxID=392032 RepID=A0A818CET8_9BILA|nr:unnamed protein product [Rotaria socialis]CAF3434427.1 unnamed protein product [Rotaria socialis]CAF3440318.1 unnamed protein product [Rotaria socialis]CAF3631530.1 unnamed protein product [Rotaria socialis]CAF3721768.1 unnamed protein product [Rotaria socialis]